MKKKCFFGLRVLFSISWKVSKEIIYSHALYSHTPPPLPAKQQEQTNTPPSRVEDGQALVDM